VSVECPNCDREIGNAYACPCGWRKPRIVPPRPAIHVEDESNQVGWDHTDPAVIRGLIIAGEGSKPWLMATEECREVARTMIANGYTPKDHTIQPLTEGEKEEVEEDIKSETMTIVEE